MLLCLENDALHIFMPRARLESADSANAISSCITAIDGLEQGGSEARGAQSCGGGDSLQTGK